MVPERQYPMHTLDQARRSLCLASYHHRQGLCVLPRMAGGAREIDSSHLSSTRQSRLEIRMTMQLILEIMGTIIIVAGTVVVGPILDAVMGPALSER